LMNAMFYNVSHLDPVTYAVVVLVIAVTATVACAVPALRAMGIDPVRALRA
jgi:ABC-type lipoprotein release transport system permease subunit